MCGKDRVIKKTRRMVGSRGRREVDMGTADFFNSSKGWRQIGGWRNEGGVSV